MDLLIIQEILDLIAKVVLLVIPFSLIIGITNYIVGLFGDFVLGRNVRFK